MLDQVAFRVKILKPEKIYQGFSNQKTMKHCRLNKSKLRLNRKIPRKSSINRQMCHKPSMNPQIFHR